MGKIIAKLAANVAFVRAAAVTAAIVLPGLLSLGLRGWIPAHYTFVATLTIGAGYFVVERQKAGGGRFIRIDKLGDALGPVAVAVAAWVKWALVEGHNWMAALILVLLVAEVAYTAWAVVREGS